MVRRNLSIALAALAAALATATLSAEPPRAATSRQPLVISPGEKAHVTLFGVKAEGSKFVYVLDRSGSMGGPGGKALAAAKAQIIASLDHIDSVQQFQIIFYNERPRVFNPTGQPGRLAFGSDGNKEQAKTFINSISADGGTDHEAALAAAIRMRPDVIFLLTDGDEPKLSTRQLERIDRLGAGIIINTIEFGEASHGEAENFLVKLARQSGGEHAYVDTTTLKAE
jgi:hypothetical protein